VRIAALLAGAALAAGCLRTSPYACQRDDQCGAGTCEPTADGRRFCAAADTTCASGRRFGDTAADLAGACTGVALPDGRSADVCLAGPRFPAAFTSCTESVCAKEPTCCGASWGSFCVLEAEMICKVSCGAQLAIATKGAVSILADDDHDGTFTVIASHANAAEYYHDVQWVDADGAAPPELLVGTANFSDAGDEQLVDRFDGKAITTAFDLRTLTDGSGGTPFARYLPIVIGSGDYDGDGAIDFAWIGSYPAFQTVHGRGSLRFEVGPMGAAGPPDLANPIGQGIGWGDVDGDGDDDLALATETQLFVLTSDHHALAPGAPIPLPSKPYWGAWGDYDGDGKLDLALAGDTYARVFHNRGGALDPKPIFALDGPHFYGGAWTDVDGDGTLDLALSENDGKLRVYRGTGATFSTQADWSSLEDQAANQIVSADVDGDHRLDLVLANHQPYLPRVYTNRGDLSYDVTPLSLPAADYESVSATDRTR
jgi:hypothetical protein